MSTEDTDGYFTSSQEEYEVRDFTAHFHMTSGEIFTSGKWNSGARAGTLAATKPEWYIIPHDGYFHEMLSKSPFFVTKEGVLIGIAQIVKITKIFDEPRKVIVRNPYL